MIIIACSPLDTSEHCADNVVQSVSEIILNRWARLRRYRASALDPFAMLRKWCTRASSGVQILPPHPEAPIAPCEKAEHPFILEFPIRDAGLWPVTNHRRLREHQNLTLLLNTFASRT